MRTRLALTLPFVLVAVLSGGLGSVADAEPILLAQFDLNIVDWRVSNSGTPSLYILIGYWAGTPSGPFAAVYHPAVGSVKNWFGETSGAFDFNLGNDPYFSDVVARMTNGVDETLHQFPVTHRSWVGGREVKPVHESSYFGGSSDLQGASVDFIRLSVNRLSSRPSEYPDSVVWSVTGTWDIYGTESVPVPEPASLLVGTGLVGLRAWRKRRQ